MISKAQVPSCEQDDCRPQFESIKRSLGAVQSESQVLILEPHFTEVP